MEWYLGGLTMCLLFGGVVGAWITWEIQSRHADTNRQRDHDLHTKRNIGFQQQLQEQHKILAQIHELSKPKGQGHA